MNERAGRLLTVTITVAPITPDEYLHHLETLDSASFLQTPAWARVKREWTSELLGWFADSGLVGVGLALHRAIPRTSWTLAYLPEGPVLDWATVDVADALRALVTHERRHRKAFAVRIGPTPVWRRWGADTIKTAIADASVTLLTDVVPDVVEPVGDRVHSNLVRLGWTPQSTGHGFSAGQPPLNFQLPLAGKSEADVLSGMNQLWRRNIKRADKSGVIVRQGGRDDLATFHALYLETAARDGFTGRPLEYFTTMWDALTSEDSDRLRVYLAEHEGDTVAATTWVRVGSHVWYSYGASSNEKREVRGSNAIQWRMIRDALACDAAVYDLRGITAGLAADDPEIGLIQFKVGTGGEAVEYVGEWDKAIRPVLYAAFRLYLDRDRLLGKARALIRRPLAALRRSSPSAVSQS